jgi:hypothetical protein
MADFKIKQNKQKINQDESVGDINDVVYNEQEMIDKYVAQTKTELDKDLLVKIGKKICEYNTSEL